MKDNFLDYLIDTIHGMAQSMFVFSSGILDGDSIGLNNNSGGSTFDLDLTNASKVLVASGDIIDISNITGSSITTAIWFENTPATTYYVGIRFQEIPYGVEANASTGDPEYPSWKQTYGEKNFPDSVTDNTTYIRLIINSITESGVDHSGRTVKVWLMDPVSLLEGTAYWEGSSSYSSPNNYVDIPYSGSNGPLGQDTSVDPPSTTATDYEVFMEGATWKKNTDLSADSTYAYLGSITGGTPPTFNVATQELLFTNSLDTSYDGPTDSGSGRIIHVDGGAVELETATSTGDTHGAQLRLTRHGATGNAEFHLEILASNAQEGTLLAILDPVQDPAGSNRTLEDSDAVTLHASIDGRMDFTRGDVDLEDPSLRLDQKMHVVLLEGTTNSDGLYSINTISDTYLVVSDMSAGTAPSTWDHSETGTATVLIPRFILGQNEPVASALTNHLDYWKGSLFVLCDGKRDVKPIRYIPNLLDAGTGDVVEFYDNFRDSGGWKPYPRIGTRLSINSDGTQTWKFGEYGPTIDSIPLERFVRTGVTFKTFVAGSGSADAHGVNIKPQDLSSESLRKPHARSLGLFNADGYEQHRLEACGRIAKPRTYFEDDFYYRTIPTHMYFHEGNGIMQPDSTFEGRAGGGMFLVCNSNDNDESSVTGPQTATARPQAGYVGIDYDRTVYFCARLFVPANTGIEYQYTNYFCGLRSRNGDAYIGLIYDATTSTESIWRFTTYFTGFAGPNTNAGISNLVGTREDDDNWIMFWFRFNLADGNWYFTANGNPENTLAINSPTDNNWRGVFYPYIYIKNYPGGPGNNLFLDYWAVWDDGVKSMDPE
jgi:hypothetical protein